MRMLLNNIVVMHFVAFMVASVIAAVIVFPDGMMDWDMQRYIVQVNLHKTIDTDFSYPHNLLRTWLYHATRVIQPITGKFEPLYGARVLTVLASVISSLFIYMTTVVITKSRGASCLGGLLWFLIPGNVFMMETLEDNTWANAFNACFVFCACMASNIALPVGKETKHNSFLWSAAVGSVLAVGINIHQQLAILFFGFFPLMILSCNTQRDSFVQKLLRLVMCYLLFVAAYGLLSIMQNYFVFGDICLYQSFHRLIHNPYSGVFPKLWFFSSGEAVNQWTERIATGWRHLLYIDAKSVVAIYYPVIAAVPILLLVLLRMARERGTLFFLREMHVLLWLSLVFGMHIPYSLLYEPHNPERWDSVLPGLIILVCVVFVLVHDLLVNAAVMQRFPGQKKVARLVICCVLALSLLASFLQIGAYRVRRMQEYRASPAMTELNSILDYLESAEDVSGNHVVLCSSKMKYSDIQVRLTYYYPQVTVVTVDASLFPIYSSHELQLRAGIPREPVFAINFPETIHFSAVRSVYDSLLDIAPEFIGSNSFEIIGIRQ